MKIGHRHRDANQFTYWEIYAAQGHRPEWIKWMKTNYNCPITEEEFVRAYRALRTADARPRKARR